MNTSLSLDAIIAGLKHFLQRFHLILFVLVTAGGLAVAIFSLNSLVTESRQETPISTKTQFDTATIERVEELRTQSESANSQISLPPGRTSPFVE